MKWLKDLFKTTPQEIWKDIRCEFLRKQMGSKDEGFWFDHRENGGNFDGRDWIPNLKPQLFYVYAIHQVSLSTGNKRIIEVYEIEKIEEYNNVVPKLDIET